jgi:Na+/H+ antiporter NhaC
MEEKRIEFYGGWKMSFIPALVFFCTCILLFVVLLSFDMHALAMGGFLGLIIGGFFAKNFRTYWNGVIKEIASENSITIVVVLFIIGMFAQMMKDSNISEGFIWIANSIGLKGGSFIGFVFITSCIIATATGSSIGTMFAAFPIFYASGVELGISPMFLAGAITSGCIFGDNLAPISDTTIASASTQTYKDGRPTDIAGVVTSRFKYSLVAGIISLVLFVLLPENIQGESINQITGSPKPLFMLIPITVLLITAIKTKDIFRSISYGLVVGIITGLVTGIFTLDSLFASSSELGNHVTGFLSTGVKEMMGTVTLVISVFGVMGVLRRSGSMEKVITGISNSRLANTVMGTEIAIAVGICLITAFFGGVTSASILTFGPIADELGRKKNIHPYRRANLIDGFANSLPVSLPFLSVFVFITAALSGLSPAAVAGGLIYPMVLFLVLCFSVLTGWGRIYEVEYEKIVKTEV